MILILSRAHDPSTNEVIDWLHCFGKSVFRVNAQDRVQLIDYSLDHFTIQVNQHQIHSSNIEGFWYRRGFFNPQIPDFGLPEEAFWQQLQQHHSNEVFSVFEVIYKHLAHKHSLGGFETRHVNKLEVLAQARLLDICLPDTLVTTQKKDLKQFFEQHQSTGIITKTINHPLDAQQGNLKLMAYTEEVHQSALDQLPDTFAPSLFQAKIDKKYELRVFYLAGEFYTMAIFSQSDTQTSVDFRRYNHQKPNRNVPFRLPQNIQQKLHRLMLACDLDTGSIDIVVDTHQQYVFLEVNPVGQFGMTSLPCNYYLEQKIARYFTQSCPTND